MVANLDLTSAAVSVPGNVASRKYCRYRSRRQQALVHERDGQTGVVDAPLIAVWYLQV